MPAAPPLDGAMAAALAEHRDRCNALVAAARRGRSAFDLDQLAAQIRGPLTAVVDACEAAVRGSASPVLDALFGPVVELVGQRRLVGGGAPHDLLLAALAHLAPVVAAEPTRVFGSLANAVLVLARFDIPVAPWLDRMVAAGAVRADAELVLQTGQVAAWACGLAHLRPSALAVAAELPVELVRVALAAPTVDDVGATVEHLRAQRWWRPDHDDDGTSGRGSEVRHRIGAFRGFGGPFLEAPLVCADTAALVVRAGADGWHVHADAFGATLTRADPAGAAAPAPPAHLVSGITHVTSAAHLDDIIAVTTATSYQVLVIEAGPR